MPGIVTNIVDVNYGEDEPAPRLVCTDVGENYEITAEALYRLTQTGAMSPDPALDEWIRKTWRIPLRVTEWEPTTRGIPSPGAPAGPVQDPDNPDLPAPAPLPAPPKPAPGKTQKTQTPAARRRAIRATAGLRRPMTAVEAASGFDPLMMKHQHANALGKLMSDYRAVLRTQRNDLVDQVIAAVKSGRPDKLAQLKADPAPGALLIQQAMDTLSQSAVNMMIAEADRQGVVIDAGKVKLPAVKLSRVAQARAALHAAWLSQQAGSKAMQTVKATRRVRAADDEGDEDADEAGDMIDSFLTDLSDVSLKDQLGAALTAAQNTGRVAVLEAAPESAGTAVYTATEINDDNTCEPCADIDGEAFESLSDAEDAYPSGGFVDCEGGLRCRGTVIAVWGGE
jgi:hypothetical protein